MKQILGKLTGIETDIKEMKTDINMMKTKLDGLDATVKKYQPVWDKAGKTFEYVVRERLRTTMGSSYARELTINNLSQLVAETLPPEILPSEKVAKRILSNEEISFKRLRKLAFAARDELDGLRSWVYQQETAEVKSSEGSRLLKKALDCKGLLAAYDALTDDYDRLEFLMFGPLGLHAFSRLAYTAKYHKGYTTEMELDLAGTAFFVLGFYRKDCAEIKTGGRDEAIDQVMVGLGIRP